MPSIQPPIFYFLSFCLIVFACNCKKTDEQAPTIQILSPTEAASFQGNQMIHLQINISDNEQLKTYKALVRNLVSNDLEHIISESTSEKSVEIDEMIALEVAETTNFAIEVETEDQSGNTAEKTINFELLPPEGGVLNLNFKLEYQGEPLVMFEEKNYPSDYSVNFTRFSFFIADVTLTGVDGSETPILDMDYLNLTDAHEQTSSAEKGFDYAIPALADGNYTALQFGIGVPPEQNAKLPADFPTTHPLSTLNASGEHWSGWNSYIFFKLEGNIDADGDGVLEKGIALHVGANDSFQSKTIETSFSITKGETTTLNMTIDLYDILVRDNTIYDLIEDGQIHNLSQLPLAIGLSENLIKAIEY